ncbi:MAG: ABC-2 transporter permease [Anaerococcus obesiensis]
MRKYLKYDAKSNMKFFISTIASFVILLISMMSIITIGVFSRTLEINSAINSIEIIVVVVFILTIAYFIINSFYKDLYTNRSILTFSLPISAREFILAKLIVINIFYWLLIFVSIFVLYSRNIFKYKNTFIFGLYNDFDKYKCSFSIFIYANG